MPTAIEAFAHKGTTKKQKYLNKRLFEIGSELKIKQLHRQMQKH